MQTRAIKEINDYYIKRDFRAEARKLILSKKPYDDPKNINQVKSKSSKKTLFDLVLDKCKSVISYIYPSYNKPEDDIIIFEEEVQKYNNRVQKSNIHPDEARINNAQIKKVEEKSSNPDVIEKRRVETRSLTRINNENSKKEVIQENIKLTNKRKQEHGYLKN